MAKTALMKIWDVQLGLAIHVKAPNGKYIVIDLGSTKDISPLRSLQGKEVGYMVISHPHLDHFSDINNIDCARPQVLWKCKSYSRQELLTGIREVDRAKITKYCDFVDIYSCPLTEDKNPSKEDFFNGLTVEVFNTDNCNKNNKNNFSAIVVLKLGNAKIVVCGDNENESFSELMKFESFKTAVEDSWILVAPHHGRESGYYDEFVTLVNPYLTVVSDDSKTETSVASKYSDKSKGYNVINAETGETKKRFCLTTRKDGNIEISFGESNDPQYIGYLHVETHK